MKGVNDFYDMYQMSRNQSIIRRVYLATDDPSVIEEAKNNYQNYEFIYDESHPKLAHLNSRYSTESAEAVIMDIHFLSRSDFLVCTFSSNICRMAYELMQTRYSTDASWRFRSLDDFYFFATEYHRTFVAIYDHVPANEQEFQFKAGD